VDEGYLHAVASTDPAASFADIINGNDHARQHHKDGGVASLYL
jgi:hypothetical protein